MYLKRFSSCWNNQLKKKNRTNNLCTQSFFQFDSLSVSMAYFCKNKTILLPLHWNLIASLVNGLRLLWRLTLFNRLCRSLGSVALSPVRSAWRAGGLTATHNPGRKPRSSVNCRKPARQVAYVVVILGIIGAYWKNKSLTEISVKGGG